MENQYQEIPLKPKIIDDIYFNELFSKNGKGYTVVGGYRDDVHIIIENNKLEYLKKIIFKLNGENSINDICKETLYKKDELLEIIQFLYIRGFIQGKNDSIKGFDEVDKMSLTIKRVNLNKISQKISKHINEVMFVIKLAFIISILVFLIAIFSVKIDFSDLIRYRSSYAAGYVLITIFMVMMFILHETGHAIAAIKAGIRPNYIGIVLYDYFIPMFYVKNKGMYSLNKCNYIKVLLAGIGTNFLAFLIFIDIYFYTHIEILKVFAVSNLKIILTNIMPLSLTDGYFIFSAITNQPNLRLKTYKILGDIFSIKGKRYKVKDYIYATLSISVTVLMVSTEMLWILKAVLFLKGMTLIISMILAITVYMIAYLIWINKKVLN